MTVEMKNTYELKDLRMVRLLVPRLIPEELIEHVKGRTFSPEEFYLFQEDRASIDNDDNLLYAIYDPEKCIVGYLWAEVNQLDKTLFVNTFSIDKKYWKNGEAISLAMQLIGKIIARLKCPRTFWMTRNPKYYEKRGFKLSKNVCMEYVSQERPDEEN
jgi:hypothetical protein